MNIAYLLIGGNQGDRISYLQQAIEIISEDAGIIVRKSALYETAAWGMEEQPDFLNQVLILETKLDAESLLGVLLEGEEKIGRKRTVKNAPRIIDIDILFFNNDVINSNELVIPHPEVQNRRFALAPLAELVPMLHHPILNKPVKQLLDECPDQLEVKKYRVL